jgi:hypothetical protein
MASEYGGAELCERKFKFYVNVGAFPSYYFSLLKMEKLTILRVVLPFLADLSVTSLVRLDYVGFLGCQIRLALYVTAHLSARRSSGY